MHHLANQQRHLSGREAQILQHTFIDALHLMRPLAVACVRLALMEEYALDDAVVLSLACQGDEVCIGVTAIVLCPVLEPVGLLPQVVGTPLLVKQLYLASAYRYVYDTYANLFGEVLQQCASEVVGRAQTSVYHREWRHRLVPLTTYAAHLRHVERRHYLQSRPYAYRVLRLYGATPLHVRLAEAEIHVEVLIRLHRALGH